MKINLRSIERMVGWTLPLWFGLALVVLTPLGTAFKFGSDEGFELMKAMLVSLGYPLYTAVWNDQPPLHTQVLSLLFQVFGPSIFVARLLSVGFAMVMVGALYQLVKQRSGMAAGLLAIMLLVSSSYFLLLSVSVMIELPALALALAAAWALSGYSAGKGRMWLVLSGVLFGSALQVKLTVVLFLPALIVEYLSGRIAHKGKGGNHPGPLPGINGPEDSDAKRITRIFPSFTGRASEWVSRNILFCDLVAWCGALLIVFCIVFVAAYKVDTLPVFWASHFSAATQRAVVPEEYEFRPEFLLNDVALLIPALLGVVVVGWKRRWNLLFPVVLLMTAFAIHVWHRPYWYYYALHFSIPLAWLGSVGIIEFFRVLWRNEGLHSIAAKALRSFGFLGWSVVISWILVAAPANIWRELTMVREASPAGENAKLISLMKHAAGTQWVFTDDVTCAFWAGLPVPPELAIIPAKRVWSMQVKQKDVLECLERYRPEVVFMEENWEETLGLSDYLRQHYEPDSTGRDTRFYLRKAGRRP